MIEKIKSLVLKNYLMVSGVRQPSSRYFLVALAGAVMVWEKGGNVVLTPQAAREISVRLAEYADRAEGKKAL